jgi:hypothetical protein
VGKEIRMTDELSLRESLILTHAQAIGVAQRRLREILLGAAREGIDTVEMQSLLDAIDLHHAGIEKLF